MSKLKEWRASTPAYFFILLADLLQLQSTNCRLSRFRRFENTAVKNVESWEEKVVLGI
jgi:hypothetical protein